MSDASEAERLALLAKRRKLMEDWSAFALHREEGLPPRQFRSRRFRNLIHTRHVR
jgi:hypothetical protein